MRFAHPFEDCRTYRVPLFACPSFLFIVLGGVTIAAMVATHLIASRLAEEPQVATLIVIGITVLMLAVGQAIVNSFRRLAEASMAKSEFVSVASHQLRTPLSSIKWASALVMEREGENPKREYLEIIRDNTERMIRLVNDLLDVSRIEAGTLAFAPRPVDLVSLTREVLGRIRPFAGASNVTLAFRPPETLPLAAGDEERLKSIMTNLVDNAIRYTPNKGAVTVTIRQEPGAVRWAVSDTGVGISPEDQKHVFEKFFRARSALKHQTVGSGLGLFVAKAVTELLGGTLAFTSEEGKGSTFWFSLPLAEK